MQTKDELIKTVNAIDRDIRKQLHTTARAAKDGWGNETLLHEVVSPGLLAVGDALMTATESALIWAQDPSAPCDDMTDAVAYCMTDAMLLLKLLGIACPALDGTLHTAQVALEEMEDEDLEMDTPENMEELDPEDVTGKLAHLLHLDEELTKEKDWVWTHDGKDVSSEDIIEHIVMLHSVKLGYAAAGKSVGDIQDKELREVMEHKAVLGCCCADLIYSELLRCFQEDPGTAEILRKAEDYKKEGQRHG